MRRIHGSGETIVSQRFNKTVGIDTDSKFLVTAYYQADSQIVPTAEYEQSLDGVAALVRDVAKFGAEKIVIESTANYHMLAYDSMREANLPVVVINPLRVKALLRVEGKSDRADAVTLARLAASFDMRGSNMPDSVQREARTYWRLIDLAADQERRTSQRITAMLIAHGTTITRLVSPSSKVYKEMLRAIIQGKSAEEVAALYRRRDRRGLIENSIGELPEYVRLAVGVAINNITYQEEEKERLEGLLKKIMDQFAEIVELLKTVPGVTDRLAWRIIAEMGDDFENRYPDQRAFCRALGIVPSNIVSGGKLLKREATHGNVRAKLHLLSNAKAWVTRSHPGPLYKWYVSYKERTNYMKATSALAHKMAEGMYIAKASGLPFDEEYYFGARDFISNPKTGEVLKERFE